MLLKSVDNLWDFGHLSLPCGIWGLKSDFEGCQQMLLSAEFCCPCPPSLLLGHGVSL